MRYLRRCRDAALLLIAVSNAYQLLNCGARLVGVYALRDTMKFDPDEFAAYLDSDISHGH